MLRSQSKETDFDDINPISILALLKSFLDGCNSTGNHEGAAIWLISCFIKKPSPSFLKAQKLRKKIHATRLHDEKLPSWIKVANYLLLAYVTDDINFQAIKDLGSYKQAPNVSAALYAKRLDTKVRCCRIVNEKRRFESLFVEQLDESACGNTPVVLR